MNVLPADDKARKMLPMWRMITSYFPRGLREVTKVCVANNVRFNPDKDPADIHWARGKSPDQLGSAFRHMFERVVDGKIFDEVPSEIAKITGIERIYVLAQAAWRNLAELELEIERQEAKSKASEAAEAADDTDKPTLISAMIGSCGNPWDSSGRARPGTSVPTEQNCSIFPQPSGEGEIHSTSWQRYDD